MTDVAVQPQTVPATRITARALLLGDRIDASGLERSDMISATPLAFRTGNGFVALYRFGVAVMFGLSPLEEDDVLRRIEVRISGKRDMVEDETAVVEVAAESEDRIPPGGPIQLRDLSPARFLVIADAWRRASRSAATSAK